MLPVTALFAPAAGLTVVTMSSWSCLVKRFTSRRSSSANSQSSRAPAQDQAKQTKSSDRRSNMKTGGRFARLPPLTGVRCDHDTLVWHPLHISYSRRSLHARLAEFLIGSLGRVTVDPDRPEPAPATQAGGTEQQRAIWAGNVGWKENKSEVQ